MHQMGTVGCGVPSKKRPALSMMLSWMQCSLFRNYKVGLESQQYFQTRGENCDGP
jgi:hypothetical protein